MGDDTGGKEVPFPSAEFGPVPLAEGLACLRQPYPPVQRARVTVQLGPGVGGFRESAVQAEAFAVLLDPAAQPGPGADQGLVGQLHGVAVDGQQALTDQAFEHVGGGGVGVQLGAGDRAPGVLGAVAGLDQAQQQGPGRGGLGGGAAGVGGLGGVGDGAVDSADGLVGGEGEGLAGAAAPDLAQGVRHQGQPARLSGDVGDDPRRQGAFDDQSAGGGGPDHGLAQPAR